MTIQDSAARTRRGSFYGFHHFITIAHDDVKVSNGQFEVWYSTGQGDECSENGWLQGWYWWPCYPGCLPDGDPSGPFPTAEGAYLDAMGD